MKIITFVIPQIISLVAIYLVYGHLFANYEAVYAWGFFGFIVLLYVSYFIYDLVDLVKRVKAAREFKY